MCGQQSLGGHSVWYHDTWDVAGEGPGLTWTVDNEAFSYRQNRRLRQPNYRRRIDPAGNDWQIKLKEMVLENQEQ
jgi:hypothetical protein